MSRPVFTADDWQALCEFLDKQRWHQCPARLVPERFKVMIAPETRDQRRVAGVILHSLSAHHRSGWHTVKGWQARIEQLRAQEQSNAVNTATIPAPVVPAPSGDET